VVAHDIGALEPLIDQLNELGKAATSFILSSPQGMGAHPSVQRTQLIPVDTATSRPAA
jgi:hypothetical protein